MSRTDKDVPRWVAHERGEHDLAWRQSAPPRFYINHIWTAPDRMAARLTAQIARAEHRAGLVPDVDPPTGQHRNGAKWMWW